VRLVAARTSAPLRRARVRLRPLRASPAAVRTALGDTTVSAALRGPALTAMPTVVAWERELQTLSGEQRAALLARADAVAAHRFDLLGSGPVDLGPEIDWQLDFKHRRSWPLDHISKVTIVYGDGSDIKVPWELSRFQHAPLLAAAYRVSGERRYRDELGAQLTHWIASNPVEMGANWACTMDVAIRAANWVAALALCAGAQDEPPAWLDDVAGSLLLHGRFIRSHLEWGEVRGNHYLSDVAGLLPVAALFSGSAEGRAWARWATGELESEMAYQVRADGCDHEASISYHRLVCELFVCGAQGADALCPGQLSGAFRERLQAMLAFVADHTRPDGLAPQVGDADSGRFLPLGAYGALDFRDHRHLFTQAGLPVPDARAPRASAAYPDGGYYVLRSGELFALVRCGDVGLDGVGGHAHNDQLSFELCAGEQPLVVDPGAYLYTADPATRNRFRSTSSHATLTIDGAEQNPLRDDYLFSLAERTNAHTLRWEPREHGALWEGRHHGYEHLPQPATHTRTVELDAAAGELRITDVVDSTGAHELSWAFPLAPGVDGATSAAGAIATWPSGARLEIEAPDCEASIEPGWVSPAYGVREPASVVRLRRASEPGQDRQEITLRYGARA